jgi:hypothetical protein
MAAMTSRAAACWYVGGLLCLFCTTVKASPKSSPVTLSEQQQTRVDAVAQVGREIFEQDAASAVATDAMLDKVPSPPPGGSWIAVRQGDGFRVDFISGVPEEARLFAEVTVVQGKTTVDSHPSRQLVPQEVSMYRARQTALLAASSDCATRFNHVILGAPGGAWDVYVLAATTEPGAVLVGGHSRVRVSSDGSHVVDSERFSKACLSLRPVSDGRGGVPVAMFVTHLLSDIPAPTHVYLSLQARKPLYVGAGGIVWLVDGSRIKAIDSLEHR